MQGKLSNITVDSSICVIEIELDTGKTMVCYAETNPFIRSINDAYGDNWHNESIDFELDSNRIMIGFNPSD